jgi:exodeoxyribonuclease V alpha subunit
MLRAAAPNEVLARAMAGFEPALALIRATRSLTTAMRSRSCRPANAFASCARSVAGRWGRWPLNAAIARRVHDGPPAWYPGRLVMVTRNETARQLFTGDVGVCLPWAQREGALAVAFVAAGAVRWRRWPRCRAAKMPGP